MQDEKQFRAKVSDFGLSAHMSAGETCVEISQGTEAYLPLEVFKEFAVTEASDIYALGLLMWEAYYGIFWFSVWDAEKKRRRWANHLHVSCFDCRMQALRNNQPYHLPLLWIGMATTESCCCTPHEIQLYHVMHLLVCTLFQS